MTIEHETLKIDQNNSRSRSKSKGTRNEMLNKVGKFIKVNASQCARSQANHIKSAVKHGRLSRPEVPNLLSRGAERFLGKT